MFLVGSPSSFPWFGRRFLECARATMLQATALDTDPKVRYLEGGCGQPTPWCSLHELTASIFFGCAWNRILFVHSSWVTRASLGSVDGMPLLSFAASGWSQSCADPPTARNPHGLVAAEGGIVLDRRCLCRSSSTLSHRFRALAPPLSAYRCANTSLGFSGLPKMSSASITARRPAHMLSHRSGEQTKKIGLKKAWDIIYLGHM